jgi:hypothetical protein
MYQLGDFQHFLRIKFLQKLKIEFFMLGIDCIIVILVFCRMSECYFV